MRGGPGRAAPCTGQMVGVDLGVGAVLATSDGRLVENARFARRRQRALSQAQRELATKKKGSHRREKARERVPAQHRKVRNQRRDFAHQVSRRLVGDYDLIVFEDLKIQHMTRRPKPRRDGKGGYEPNRAKAKTGLNRAILDAGWGDLLAMTTYKAESAGRDVVVVDPPNTSPRCAVCGHVSVGNRCGAVFRCQACRHEAHAHTNAAVNILGAGRARQRLAA